ncbi:ATP-binding cassette domain-containing protein [Clostridium saccharobutylicum]|uniref:ABC transporter ATP-binding protein/permease n=1 Tax=Clostridium saccharobutylicum TaxID=169679 RepID=UPI000985AD4A|nr:ABC transporter ATP-binding protein/permease [Clostridium saccharobutylicum]MBC2435658.1 ATP-binding cassette domain-containing protein [Clostridium saccharobutylicum]NSB87068.1 ABC-type lipoprotein export system ATPase subunit/ABC-type lipoprotein release transport system permease subunit [Clostridium saccharobutylicum]NYC30026.1 ABC-type lipoprotein export system ATPase subunit/ABC-type lipoprotein release transport system permease subunit [Clostridium saccharobutylicum]
MCLLELKNINKYYKISGSNKFHVIKDVNVSFNKGELVSIIGESGSGKSTLMNLIGGLDSNYLGELLVNGKDIGKLRKKELDTYRKSKVGFVFQSFNLISHLSILDNVTIAMTLSNVKKKARIKRAKEILSELGLENQINKKPSQLSGGQKQRVAIARALINNPEIIIADEPTGSLDSKTTMQVLEILRNIAEKGKLVIMVTHSEKVASCSSRVVKIADGKIISDDEIFKFENTYNLEDSSSNQKRFKFFGIRGKNLGIISAVKLALKNMKEKFARNIFLSIGGSIGIMSVILMLSLGNGVKTYFNTMMNSHVNPLVIEVNMPSEEDDKTIDLDVAKIQKPEINKEKSFEDTDIQKLSQIENVSQIEKGYTLISMGSNSLSYNGKGSNLIRLSTISSNITESNIQEGSLPKEGEILINKAVSDKLGGDVVGQKVTLNLLLNQKTVKAEFVVSGIENASGDLSSIIKSVFLNYSDLEKIYSENNSALKPNVMYINTTSEKYTPAIKEKVKEFGYSGSSQEQMTSMFNEMINITTYALSGIAAISLIVSAIMIIVVMYISVVERTKEIGIIKAIGARRKDIRRIFVCEAFLIGVFSGVIGLVFSYAVMNGINTMSNKLFNINVVIIKNSYAAFGVGVSIIISILSGILPANKASKLDPVESLRRE